MICPRCHARVGEASPCSECGLQLLRRVAIVMKTSAVMISAGGRDDFYGSVSEVPAPLRLQLEEATNGRNSGTILIADKGARDRILAHAGAQGEAMVEQPQPHPRPRWVRWAGVALAAAALAIIAMVWGKWPNG